MMTCPVPVWARRAFWPAGASSFFSSRGRHTRWLSDWSSDVCSSDLRAAGAARAWGRALNRAVVVEFEFRERIRSGLADSGALGACQTADGRVYPDPAEAA